MDRATPRMHRLRLMAAALCCLCQLSTTRAHATSAETISERLLHALTAPNVQAGSTTPNLLVMTGDNHLEQLLVTTPEVVGGMREAVLHAKHEILLQIYEWNADDEAAGSVMDALWQRTLAALNADAEPLVVRIVVSATFWAENNNKQTDLHDLIDYVAKHPRAPGRVAIELSRWRASPLSILHSKVLICDAATALVMTGNLNTHGGLYRDSFNMAARITGPVVGILRADWADVRKGATRRACSSQSLPKALHMPATAAVKASKTPALTAAVLSRHADWRPWKGSDTNPQGRGFIALIDAAQERINIINPSLSIAQVQDALRRAIVGRGVEVFVTLSKEMNRDRDRRFFGGDNVAHVHRLFETILQQGGPQAADRLHIAWGAQDGVVPSTPHDAGNIHAKVTSIDNNAFVIGSANFNWLSWYNSREVSVALIGPGVAQHFLQSIFRPLYHRAVPLSHTHLEVQQQTDANPVYRYLRTKDHKIAP